jgi:hypothetical protein
MSTERLTELVEFARRNSPYYRALYAAVKPGSGPWSASTKAWRTGR